MAYLELAFYCHWSVTEQQYLINIWNQFSTVLVCDRKVISYQRRFCSVVVRIENPYSIEETYTCSQCKGKLTEMLEGLHPSVMKLPSNYETQTIFHSQGYINSSENTKTYEVQAGKTWILTLVVKLRVLRRIENNLQKNKREGLPHRSV